MLADDLLDFSMMDNGVVNRLHTEIEAIEHQLALAEQQRDKLRHPDSIYAYNQQCKQIDKLRDALHHLTCQLALLHDTL